jgi:hypothetical protein
MNETFPSLRDKALWIEWSAILSSFIALLCIFNDATPVSKIKGTTTGEDTTIVDPEGNKRNWTRISIGYMLTALCLTSAAVDGSLSLFLVSNAVIQWMLPTEIYLQPFSARFILPFLLMAYYEYFLRERCLSVTGITLEAVTSILIGQVSIIAHLLRYYFIVMSKPDGNLAKWIQAAAITAIVIVLSVLLKRTFLVVCGVACFAIVLLLSAKVIFKDMGAFLAFLGVLSAIIILVLPSLV